jgi:ABC-type transport system substrate-binding protein
MQIYASYFAAIGVNMKLNIMDPTSFTNTETAFQYDALIDANAFGNMTAPTRQILDFYSGQFNNWSRVNLPAYDALVAQMNATTDIPTQQSIMIQADMMELNNFWIVQGVQGMENDVHQPWFSGWHGEMFGYWSKVSWAYYWINESLKQ